jgi:hypothetical protein
MFSCRQSRRGEQKKENTQGKKQILDIDIRYFPMHAPSAVRQADSVIQSCSIGMHLGPAKNCTIITLGIMRFQSGEVGEVSQHYIGKNNRE